MSPFLSKDLLESSFPRLGSMEIVGDMSAIIALRASVPDRFLLHVTSYK